MGWSGSLSASSAVGSAITYTPDTSGVGSYTVGTFKAPKKGVYRFQLRGSGGQKFAYSETGASNADGGVGGSTDGYLLLEENQTVYVGAGGPCSAAFVSAATGASLAAIAKANLHFVAGGGGGGGAGWGQQWNMKSAKGGAGGGTSGASGETVASSAATGGSQTAAGSGASAGAYGVGGANLYGNANDASGMGGRGGDGLYGGGGGHRDGGWGNGGGGGSGYVKTASLTVSGKTYNSSTTQGGGAASASRGSVVVTYYAQADLPVTFDGVKLTQIIFNGTQVGSLIVDGVKLFMRAWGRAAHKMTAEVV